MSGLDPLAALAADAALQQSSLAAIDLGVAVEILQAQLSVGDLLTATILPPQGGSDLLSFLGQTVLAQLPPGINPGQSLLLQVTGFAGNQIVVRNLGVVDPENPPPTAQVVLPPAGSTQQATLTTVLANPPQATQGSTAQAPVQAPAASLPSPPEGLPPAPPAVSPAGPIPGAVAPPRAVFVAASVQPAPPGPAAPNPLPPAQSSAPVPATPAQPDAAAQPAAPTPAAAAEPVAATSAAAAQPATPPQPGAVAPSPTPPGVPEAEPQIQTPAALQAILAQVVSEVEGDLVRLGLEARIVATRAASIDLAGLVAPGSPAGKLAANRVPEEANGAQSPQATPLPKPDVSPLPKPGVSPPPAPVVAARQQAAPPAPVALRAEAAVAAREASTPEAALLARLRVPVLPLTTAAAKLIAQAASLLPRTFARLDATLAAAVTPDPRVSSLRTLLGFITRLEPGNARALPEQLMAYVANVVDGAESKVASIVRALLQAMPQGEREAAQLARRLDASMLSESGLLRSPVPSSPSGLPPGAAPSAAAASAAEAAAAETLPGAPATAPLGDPALAPPGPAPSDANAALPAATSAVAAHVAERMTALQYDLKTAIASLIESPPHGAPAALASALGDALTTVTALQLNVLGAQNADPNGITIPLPVFYHDGGRPVQLRISRDAPRGGKLDADNFHIAFVLDTRSLGTVAVDLQTVGRDVSVNVKTEGPTAAGRFRETLDELRGRLEQLHYRVTGIIAGVAPHRPGSAEPIPAPKNDDGGKTSAVDLRA